MYLGTDLRGHQIFIKTNSLAYPLAPVSGFHMNH